MQKVTMIGVDLAKAVFQVHGATMSGQEKFRKKLSRQNFPRFMAEQPPAVVVMEACGSAHYWAREMIRLGHEVKLIAPHYVKPFVKRQKNDAADAQAIVIAAQRPEMRFVEPKCAEQQSRAILFRARERLVRQRTELVNALRAASMNTAMLFRRESIRSSGLRKSWTRRTATCPIYCVRNVATCWNRSPNNRFASTPEPRRSRFSPMRLTQRGACRRSPGLAR